MQFRVLARDHCACVVCCSKTLCHPETCLRLALCAILKNVHFWNMLQISTVQTLSYRSRMLNARSWSIKTCARRPKVKPNYCICLLFSNQCRATSDAMSLREIVLFALDMTIFQCTAPIRMAHISKRLATRAYRLCGIRFHASFDGAFSKMCFYVTANLKIVLTKPNILHTEVSWVDTEIFTQHIVMYIQFYIFVYHF